MWPRTSARRAPARAGAAGLAATSIVATSRTRVRRPRRVIGSSPLGWAGDGRGILPRRGGAGSLVEPDLEAVAVLHLVVAAFEPHPGTLARRRLAAGLEQLLARHHLGADEALRQVGVDLPRRVHRLLAPAQRPGAHLVGTDGEERDQPQQPVACPDDEREPVLLDAQLAPERVALAGGQPHHLALQVGAQAD